MQFDLYIQGSPEKKDGEIMLSLSESELRQVLEHPFSRVDGSDRAVEDLVGRLVGSPAFPGKPLKSEELERFVPKLQKICERMRERDVYPNSPRNPMIQQDFYLNQVFSILFGSVQTCVNNNRELIMIADPLEFDMRKHVVCLRTDIRKFDGFCSIDRGALDLADPENERYSGTVSFSDHIEGSGGSEEWIAKPIPAGIRMRSRGERYKDMPFYVREKAINNLTNGYTFTLLNSLNREMRDCAFDMIKQFKESAKTPSTPTR